MMNKKRTDPPSIFYLLYLSHGSENQIRNFLANDCAVPQENIQRGMHLTLYHGKRRMPGLKISTSYVTIEVNTEETRFMVLAPGGENPRADQVPSSRSVGIRLTKRNTAIDEILKLRRSVYKFEPVFDKAFRKNTTDWKNAFGAKNFQPHIKLFNPGTKIDDDLTKLGDLFRKNIREIEFSKAVLKVYD
jgi:hypothetical protein